MKFEFAKYSEITDYAFERSFMYKNDGYTRLFICPDVWDFQLIRVLPGFNKDYEPEEGKILVEHNMIPMDRKCQTLTIRKLNEIIDEDDFSNYDYFEFTNMEDVIDSIADIHGILNLKEELV